MLALPTAFLTQLIYPGYYDQVLTVQPWILVVLTLRNVLEVVLLVCGIVGLVRLGSGASAAPSSGAPSAGASSGAARSVRPRGRMDP